MLTTISGATSAMSTNPSGTGAPRAPAPPARVARTRPATDAATISKGADRERKRRSFGLIVARAGPPDKHKLRRRSLTALDIGERHGPSSRATHEGSREQKMGRAGAG